MGFNDGEGGKGTGSVVLVHFSGSLEKTRVEIEDITRVSFSTRGSSQQKRHLSVSDGLLGKIVIDDKSVFTIVSEVFTNSATRVRSQELKGSCIRSSSADNNSELHAVVLLKNGDEIGNSGSLLTNGDVDAVKLLVNISTVESFSLIDDGVNSNGGFTSLSISNNKFSLSSSNGHKGVNTLDTSLHWFVDGLSGNNTRSLNFNSSSGGGLKRTKSINGVT